MTDGTAILGLGNIGPVAGMPVMEGKAVLFDQFAGISGIPILLNTSDPDEVVETIKHIQQGFGGILLEDIGSPHCFEIEERLKAELRFRSCTMISMVQQLSHWHLYFLLVNKLMSFSDSVVGQIGLGAAGLAISRMLMEYGVKEMRGIDRNEVARERFARSWRYRR